MARGSGGLVDSDVKEQAAPAFLSIQTKTEARGRIGEVPTRARQSGCHTDGRNGAESSFGKVGQGDILGGTYSLVNDRQSWIHENVA